MKLKEWVAHWQEVYDKPAVRPSTYQANGYLLKNHIVPRLGEMELTSLTETTVRRFPKDCHDHGNLRRNEPLSQETLRHSYVVQALHSGKELREISAELGHTRARETRKRYKDSCPRQTQKPALRHRVRR